MSLVTPGQESRPDDARTPSAPRRGQRGGRAVLPIGERRAVVAGDRGRLRRRDAMLAAAVTESFADMLRGGHPNSLGRTEDVVELVLAERAHLEALFAAMDDPDEVVRMRVGDALEKVCRERPGWFVAHIERLLGELGRIEQPSVQWHVAQMLERLRGDLSESQARRATELLQHNLTTSHDWIVLNVTMDVLTEWARTDAPLAGWLRPELERLRHDDRRSVAKRAAKRAAELAE
jgi:hypothetical protein